MKQYLQQDLVEQNFSLQSSCGLGLIAPTHPRDFDIPDPLGCGSIRLNDKCNGFLTAHGQYFFHDDVEISFTQEECESDEEALEIAILLEGEVTIPNKLDSELLALKRPGQFEVWSGGADHSHKAIHHKAQPIEYVVIRAESSILKQVTGYSFDEVYNRLLSTSPEDASKPFSGSGSSADLILATRQFLHAPFSKDLQRIYREGKLREILVLVLNEFENHTAFPREARLSSGDKEKIFHARDILRQRMEDPPGLIELAHLVGVNEQKLKVGFKATFGTTVFDYLKQLRLEEARRLLLCGDMSVSEVALAIGYTHFGHFAASFKKRFGMSPSDFKRQ